MESLSRNTEGSGAPGDVGGAAGVVWLPTCRYKSSEIGNGAASQGPTRMPGVYFLIIT